MMTGLKDNCASKIEVTQYLVIVSCPQSGLIETFRTDTLERIDSFKLSTFSDEWSVIRALKDAQLFLVIPVPDIKDPARTQRLTIYEYICNVQQMLGENGSAPIYKGTLYSNAPFPVANTANYGNVRAYAEDNVMAVTQQKFDNI